VSLIPGAKPLKLLFELTGWTFFFLLAVIHLWTDKFKIMVVRGTMQCGMVDKYQHLEECATSIFRVENENNMFIQNINASLWEYMVLYT
jgi:hypothetical protein